MLPEYRLPAFHCCRVRVSVIFTLLALESKIGANLLIVTGITITVAERPINYAKLRVLLIDGSGNMRSTIKGMLLSLGYKHVDAIPVTEDLLERIAASASGYDIILLGHNVNDRISGIAILEEARFRGYIKPSCSWILMTSDSSQASVLQALDSKPDEVLTKPFTMEELHKRMDLLSYSRITLEPIERAIERNALNRAINLCDTMLSPSDPSYPQAQMIKGQLLLGREEYLKAEKVFEAQYHNTHNLQAGYHLAQCHYSLGETQAAKKLLTALIEGHDLLIPAYDLLAKVHEKEGDLEQARVILQTAVAKSPLGINRQMELGRVAVQGNALDVAEQAFRKSIRLGETHFQASAEPYLKLANLHRVRAAQLPNEQKARVVKMEQLLSRAEKRFADDPHVEINSWLIKSQLCSDLNQTEEAFRLRQEAVICARELDDAPDIEALEREVRGEPPLVAPASQIAETLAPGSGRDSVMSNKVNRIGVRNYLASKQGQAIRYFDLAIQYDSSNVRALLNLAQLFLESARDTPDRRDERVKMYRRYLHLAAQLATDKLERTKLETLQAFNERPLDELRAGMLGALLK